MRRLFYAQTSQQPVDKHFSEYSVFLYGRNTCRLFAYYSFFGVHILSHGRLAADTVVFICFSSRSLLFRRVYLRKIPPPTGTYRRSSLRSCNICGSVYSGNDTQRTFSGNSKTPSADRFGRSRRSLRSKFKKTVKAERLIIAGRVLHELELYVVAGYLSVL